MRLAPILSATALLLAGGGALAADICPAVPRAQWLPEDAIAQKARALGYQVRIVQEEHGCWEVKGTDAAGKRVEVYFHPGNAEVVKVKG